VPPNPRRCFYCCCCCTGVKALDTLTPLGRGASLLVIGPGGSGKTTLALDAVQTQAAAGVRCVMACTTLTPVQLEARLKVGVWGGGCCCCGCML
jgi:RecA/RadA recombinase